MKKQIILDQGDIEQIIANSFSVDISNVLVETYTEIEGYGKGECYVARVKAKVEVPMNDQR